MACDAACSNGNSTITFIQNLWLMRMKQIGTKRLNVYWWFTKMLLKLLALWPILNDNSLFTRMMNDFQLYIISISTLYQIIGMTAMCYMTFTDFISAAESIGPMMGLYVSFGKICLYRYQRYRLAYLAQSIEDCVNNDGCDEYKYFHKFARTAIIACGSLHCVCLVLSLGYLSYPSFTTEKVLPFAVYYPWNWCNSTILYSISYSHEVIGTLLLTNANATEFTYVWSICHCCARLRVVRQGLIEFSSDDVERDEKEINKFISSFVKIHSKVIRDVEFINGAYTNIVFLLFLAAVVAICCAGLQLTSASAKSSYAILFLLLAIYFAEQLLFYYLPGDILAEEAFAVGLAAYSSGWEFLDAKHRKTMALMIMRSNVPLKLRAGNLSPLRLENYASFMATTMSYFTSVQAVATG